MKKFIWFFIILTIFPTLLFSQKPVRVNGTWQMEIPDNLSKLEVLKQVKDLAQINALEREFGSVVVQGNSTYISNEQTGTKTRTKSVFNFIADRCVIGKITKEIKTEFREMCGSRKIGGKEVSFIEITCDVEAEALKITTPPLDIKAFPLSCTDEKCQTTDFKNLANLYLFFSSPKSGYITVYLDSNNDTTQCIYPYPDWPESYEEGVPVVADKKYILFSEKQEFNYFPGENIKFGHWQLFTNKEGAQDMNVLFVIFSKTPINKPFLSGVSAMQDGGKTYKLPKYLKSADFQNWLHKYQSFDDTNFQVAIIDITITK